MIFSITKGIFNTGLKKYAKLENQELEKIQIQVTMDEEGNLTYKKSVDYEPKEIITFLDIMDKKLDILNYKQISTPVMQQSIITFCNELEVEILKISVFITNQNDQLYLMIYDEKKFVKHILLKEHLKNINLE